MENQRITTGIRNELFRKDLAKEIQVDQIKELPLEINLSIPKIDEIKGNEKTIK